MIGNLRWALALILLIGIFAPSGASWAEDPLIQKNGEALEGASEAEPAENDAIKAMGKDGVILARLENAPIITATERFIMTRLDRAEAEGKPFLLILDTPGGAVDTTRSIVQRFLGSTVPIIVWVGPPGSRAGSAGVFITMAGHVAAMAPGTNIGAAHPIGAGVGAPGEKEEGSAARRSEEEVLAEKIENDLVAFAEAIATARERNVEWAIAAVRDSASIPVDKALELKVIDLIAEDIPSLLAAIDGKEVKTKNGMIRLETKGAEVIETAMSLRERLQTALGDPSIAYLLMSLGVMGIVLELYNPGMMIGGIFGGLCLVLAAASGLPFNMGGLLLLGAAGILFTLEVYITSYGLLALAGSACLILGGIFLFEAPPDLPEGMDSGVAVGTQALVSVGLISLVSALGLAYLIGKSQLRGQPTGGNALVGQEAEVVKAFVGGKGRVFINGEYWNARSSQPVPEESIVRVEEMKGLLLIVSPVPGAPSAPKTEPKSA